MPTIKASYIKIQELLGKKVSLEELDDLLSFAKTEIDDYVKEEDMLVLDVKTSNRPDLWCPEGMIREIQGILKKDKGIPEYEVRESKHKVVVSKELSKTRPYIACAVAKNIHLTDYYIKQLMQLSEKIDHSYGRRRKRTSIGMYNLAMIKSPVEYKTVKESHKFIPLGHEKEMPVNQILDDHEKGKEYGQIVKGYGLYPILLSADGMTLSLPPVINSNDVGRITEDTNECLIEVTGTNYDAVNVVLNIICQTMADHGAEIYSVEIDYPPEIRDQTDITPKLKSEEITIDLNIINKYLGTKITPTKAKKLIESRRFNVLSSNKNKIVVTIPPYRNDILHWVDIAEEIAIASDYNKIGPTKWNVLTTGGILPETESENTVRDILVGTGAVEVFTNTLIDPEILTTKINDTTTPLAKLENPISLTYSVVRDKIYPNLINILSKNTHEPYPQAIFEVGEVIGLENKRLYTETHASYSYADADASFENAHMVLHQLMSLLGVKYELHIAEHPTFTDGRCGKIKVDGKYIGIIGEVNPAVLEKNMIWVPTVVFEIYLPLIPSLKCKRKYTY